MREQFAGGYISYTNGEKCWHCHKVNRYLNNMICETCIGDGTATKAHINSILKQVPGREECWHIGELNNYSEQLEGDIEDIDEEIRCLQVQVHELGKRRLIAFSDKELYDEAIRKAVDDLDK